MLVTLRGIEGFGWGGKGTLVPILLVKIKYLLIFLMSLTLAAFFEK